MTASVAGVRRTHQRLSAQLRPVKDGAGSFASRAPLSEVCHRQMVAQGGGWSSARAWWCAWWPVTIVAVIVGDSLGMVGNDFVPCRVVCLNPCRAVMLAMEQPAQH